MVWVADGLFSLCFLVFYLDLVAYSIMIITARKHRATLALAKDLAIQRKPKRASATLVSVAKPALAATLAPAEVTVCARLTPPATAMPAGLAIGALATNRSLAITKDATLRLVNVSAHPVGQATIASATTLLTPTPSCWLSVSVILSALATKRWPKANAGREVSARAPLVTRVLIAVS